MPSTLSPLAKLPLVEKVTAALIEQFKDELTWLKATSDLTRRELERSARRTGHQLASNDDLRQVLEGWLRLDLVPAPARPRVTKCLVQVATADRHMQEALTLARQMAATAPNPPAFEPRFHSLVALPSFCEQIEEYIVVEGPILDCYRALAKDRCLPLTQVDLDDWEDKTSEGLDIADIYDEQIARWQASAPTVGQLGMLAMARTRNGDLRTILNDQLAVIAILRTKTLEAVNALLRPEEKTEELARLLGKPAKPKAATH